MQAASTVSGPARPVREVVRPGHGREAAMFDVVVVEDDNELLHHGI